MYWIAVLSLAALTQAQSTSFNLTLTFSPSNSDSCITKDNATDSAITFSTATIPPFQTCINLNETFLSNTSNGFTPADMGFRYTSSFAPPAGVNWSTYNAAAYSPVTTNYSQIWYQQVNISGEIGSGNVASRYILVYPTYNCQEASDFVERPDYGYSCQSDAEGQCDTASYSVQSFHIMPVTSTLGYSRKCYDFRNMESAGSVVVGKIYLTMMVAVLVGMSLA